MSRKSNVISSIDGFLGYDSHVAKGSITTDRSTLKIYNKKEKKNILDFLIKFFIFTFLIWILQVSSSCDSCRSWNYENDLKKTLNLGAKRSLAEGENIKKPIGEELKLCEHDVIDDPESKNKKEEKEEKEKEEEEEEKEEEEEEEKEEEKEEEEKEEKNKNVECNNITLESCACILNTLSLSVSSCQLFYSLILYSKDVAQFGLLISGYTTLILNLSILIYSILSILGKFHIKHKEL
ncbi:fam-h protein [Plasmodium relictum]|uniref:Fam-h protein n=1 Tax=Plasmodium relictum TaxID=85471 RepID=A0A1J1GMZ4_PLARL|nr:fam-h protein [Plasmodium relictum]CRG84701.1 fam-h protein [Plasmodium relictum]